MRKFQISCPGCGLRIWPVEADSKEVAVAVFCHLHQEERPDCNCEYFDVIEASTPNEEPWDMNIE